MTVRSVVAGVGSALPKRRVDNDELAKTVDTSDQWIVERTGIRSRYVAGEVLGQAIDTVRELNAEGACASLDMFTNYVARGEAFVAAVEALA